MKVVANWGAKALLLCLVSWVLTASACRSNTPPSKPPVQSTVQTQDAELQDDKTLESDPRTSTARLQSAPIPLTRFKFRESASQLGVEFTYRNGEETNQFAIIENLGGGVGIFDYDLDGKLDLFCVGGGEISAAAEISGLPNSLFRNLGTEFFVEVSNDCGWNSQPLYGHGITVWDQNNDGFPDVLTTGYGGAQFFLNNGDGTFRRVESESLSQVDGIVTSACSGDFSGDGIPDLYVTTYVDWSFENHIYCPAPTGDRRELCSPKEFQGTRDYLFVSEADGDLRSITGDWLKQDGKGLGALACDFDHDGDVDIYVANDTNANFLYSNQTEEPEELRFADTGMLSGVALDERGLPNGSMGVTACDVNHDLRADIWVANYERESFALYRNEGQGSFLHTSRRYGIAALGGLYVGFGTDWEDFDNDGQEEIVVSNGHVLRYPTGAPRQQRPLLLARVQDRFLLQEFPEESYFAGRYDGRGLAVGDLNNDGQPDIAISHINHPVAILINQTDASGEFLNVRLVGTSSSRDAVGAHLVLTTTHGKQLRSIVGGGSYLSHNDRVAHFGIPQGAEIKSLEIRWPSGTLQSLTDISSGDLLVVEPSRD